MNKDRAYERIIAALNEDGLTPSMKATAKIRRALADLVRKEQEDTVGREKDGKTQEEHARGLRGNW